MPFALKPLLRHALLLTLTILLGGLAGATLVRLAPGFDADDAALNVTRSAASAELLRASRDAERNVFVFYARYLWNLLRGDFGQSRTYSRPVRELLAERAAVTWELMRMGLLAGCGLGLLFAVWSISWTPAGRFASLLSGGLLCLPSAIAAIAALVFELPVWVCIAAVVFPRVFRLSHEVMAAAAAAPHVLAARARGVAAGGLLVRHILPPVMPQTFALLGVTVNTAMAADIPVEVLAGVPGLGQLAWQAASGRDLPVLVAITMLLGAVSILANALADAGTRAWEYQA